MTDAASVDLVQRDDHQSHGNGSGHRETVRLSHDCRDLVARRVGQLVSAMLDRVDDTLFDLAEKSDNMGDQTVYFDAMREVRMKRPSIEIEFERQLQDIFDKAMRSDRQAELDSFQDMGGMELGLVEEDDLEASLAVEGMASKVRSGNAQGLFALDKRMGVLLKSPGLELEDNPLGPEAICSAIKEACGQIQSGIKVKLIMLKLFDRFVVSELPQVYVDVNDFLAGHNVLPQLRYGNGNRPRGRKVAPQQDSPATGGQLEPTESEQDQLFNTLRRLLSEADTGGLAGPTGVQSVSGDYTQSSAEALHSLTMIQQGNLDAVAAEGVCIDAGQLSSGTGNVLRGLKGMSVGAAGGRVDDMTIDIVAMLFDFIFDDRAIPAAMKALIGQMQIPVLKVAFMDKSVFAKKGHPVRRLVNALADASIGWHEEDAKNDLLYQKAESIVQRILNGFAENLDIFSELLEEFEVFLAEEERKSAECAERSARLAQGRERLELGKALARDEVRRRTAQGGLPQAIRDFLATHWAALLTVSCVKEGKGGDMWRWGIRTMDLLIWSVASKPTPEKRERLVKLLPQLVKALKTGMDKVSMPANERAALMAELARCHARAVSTGAGRASVPAPVRLASPVVAKPPLSTETHAGQAPPAAIQRRPAVVQASTPRPVLDADGSSVTDRRDELPVGQDNVKPFAAELAYSDRRGEVAGDAGPVATPEGHEERQEGADEVSAEFQRLAHDGVEIQEVTLSDPNAEPFDEGEGDEHVDMAKGLAQGTWVEFQQEDGSSVRARLTWISSVSGVYLFTNRKGLKAAERTLQGLAAEFRRGSASIIENVPLFDKAFTSLLDGLKKAS